MTQQEETKIIMNALIEKGYRKSDLMQLNYEKFLKLAQKEDLDMVTLCQW